MWVKAYLNYDLYVCMYVHIVYMSIFIYRMKHIICALYVSCMVHRDLRFYNNQPHGVYTGRQAPAPKYKMHNNTSYASFLVQEEVITVYWTQMYLWTCTYIAGRTYTRQSSHITATAISTYLFLLCVLILFKSKTVWKCT